jgi:hypothetical protein
VNGYEGLCLYEPAWKIEAMVFREPAAEFPAASNWQPEALPAPENGHFQVPGLANVVEGVTLRLICLAGPGVTSYSNGAPVSSAATNVKSSHLEIRSRGPNGSRYELAEFYSARPHVCYEVAGLKPEQRLDFLVSNGTGGLKPTTEQSSRIGSRTFVPLPVFPGTKEIRIAFVVQTGHRLACVVSPPASKR